MQMLEPIKVGRDLPKFARVRVGVWEGVVSEKVRNIPKGDAGIESELHAGRERIKSLCRGSRKFMRGNQRKFM